jgi:hypothetical protein
VNSCGVIFYQVRFKTLFYCVLIRTLDTRTITKYQKTPVMLTNVTRFALIPIMVIMVQFHLLFVVIIFVWRPLMENPLCCMHFLFDVQTLKNFHLILPLTTIHEPIGLQTWSGIVICIPVISPF